MVKISKKSLFIIISTIALIYFIYFTRPVSLERLVNIKNIAMIDILELVNPSNLSKDITIRDKDDINQLLEILNNYQYRKRINIRDTNVVNSNISDSKIYITIHYIDKEDNININTFFIDPDNKITIDNIGFKLKGKDKKLFKRIREYFYSKI